MNFEPPPEPSPAPPPSPPTTPAPDSTRRARRRPRPWLIALLAALVVAVGLVALALRDDGDGGGEVGADNPGVSSSDGGQPSGSASAGSGVSPAQRRVFDELMKQVAEVRGLQWKEPLNLRVVGQDELDRLFQQSLDRDADPVQLAAEEATLKILGLVPASLDYKKLVDDLLAEQVLGFYDPETKELFVGNDGGDEIDGYTRWIIAHEMNHALTDQVFNYGPTTITLDKEDRAEELAAYSALLEGDAVLVQTLWAEKHLSTVEQLETRLGRGGDVGVFVRAPEYIQRALFFPYDDGLKFVEELHRSGGFAAVDAAYRSPPTSTEHILHPETYRAGQASASPPLPDLAAASGCSRLRSGIVGQFDMRAILDQHLTATDAGRAVEGWNGDAFSLVRCGSSVGLADRWRADGTAEATRLVDALSRWAGQWSGGRQAPGADGRFSGPTGAGRIVRNGNTVDLVLAQDADTAERLVRALS